MKRAAARPRLVVGYSSSQQLAVDDEPQTHGAGFDDDALATTSADRKRYALHAEANLHRWRHA